MLTLLGSLLGFVTSTGPSIFKTFMEAKQDARDKEHELQIMAQQSQDRRDEAVITSAGQANVSVQRSAQEHTKRASQWVIDLSATVRPLITYFFFLEFVLLTLLSAFGVIESTMYKSIWTPNIEAIFATIVAFWFGQRLVSKWVK